MRILLVNPPASNGIRCVREGRCEQRGESFQYLMVPISLPYIAAVLLNDGFEVEVIDCIAHDLSLDDLSVKVRGSSLVIVNVATVSFKTDREVASMCKKLNIPCAAYGVHVTTTPDETMATSDFDFLIHGEPEIISLNLARHIMRKTDLSLVNGVSYRHDGRVVHNRPAEFGGDLDVLPFPARQLIDNSKYIAPLSHIPYTLLVASRGCPFNCIYCTAHKYYGKKVRFRSADSIVAEMRHCAKKIGVSYIAMWSDTFTVDKKFVLELCRKIREAKLDVEWYCNSRVDTVDEEMIKAMAESNCRVITFGVESLDQRILDNMKKGIKVAQVKKAFSLCRKYGIKTQAHLIFGLPGESHESINNTISRIKDANPDYAEFYCAVPFPGTEFNELVTKNGYLTTEDYCRFEINQAIVSYPDLSNDEIKQAMVRAYRAFYLRPSYVWKKVLEFPISEWPSVARQAFSWAKDWIFA